MTFEEFTRYREQASKDLHTAYRKLLVEPVEDESQSLLILPIFLVDMIHYQLVVGEAGVEVAEVACQEESRKIHGTAWTHIISGSSSFMRRK